MAAFLSELRDRDIQVWPDGDQLRCNAPAAVLTPELREQLRMRKRDIVDFLKSAAALSTQQRAIVPLQQRGSRTPVFAVAGHNGDVFCYRALTQHLGDDQPFFGLQPPGLDRDEKPLTSVEDLASYFAAQIREFRSEGPIVIAGYCAGGVIAFELAQQLAAQGSDISFVALFSGAYPTWYGVLPQLRHRLWYEMKRAGKHARKLGSLPFRQGRAYITEKLRRKSRVEAETPDEVLTKRARIKAATGAAVCRYTPQHFNGRVSLFLPSREGLRPGSELLRWRSLAAQVDEYCGPDGCEGDVMLLEPWAGAIAELFQRHRAKTEQ